MTLSESSGKAAEPLSLLYQVRRPLSTRKRLESRVIVPYYKSKIYSGVVMEQLVFYSSATPKSAEPRPTMRTDQEKADYNEKQSLRRFIRNVNENFTPEDYYTTFTLDDDHLVDTFPEAREIREKFIRSLRRDFPDVKLIMVMGRGKRTNRIHYHAIIAGASRKAISRRWLWGKLKNIEHLREHNYYNGLDHGADYTGLAIYLFEHWTPEQGKGKRWRQTINMRKPGTEKPKIAKRSYSESKPPITPKGYRLVETRSTQYGFLYFKYIKIAQKPIKKRTC